MPERGRPLRRLGFLTIGLFDAANPRPGHEQTLRLIEHAEVLGFDSVWVRQRHLQPGISSPVAVLDAASQRTNRIALGIAVIPLGIENPLRLGDHQRRAHRRARKADRVSVLRRAADQRHHSVYLRLAWLRRNALRRNVAAGGSS